MKTLHLSIIIVSILLAILLQPVHAQNPPEINPRNVTLLVGFDSPSLQRCCESIALSHDGSMLAYSIDSFDVKSAGWKSFLSLYFFKNQTSRSLNLNNNLEMIYDLNFSPDDKKLLFIGSSCDKKQSTTTYYIFNPSDIQLHCNTMSNIRTVDWMPDGAIVILRNNEKNDTVSIYQNGIEKLLYEKQIGPPYISLNSSHIWSISASPDGKKIALWYLVMRDHKTQILDVNTGKIITTIDGGHPEWSADGHTLSYTLPTSTGFLSNGARGVDTSINLLDVASNKTTTPYHIPTGVDFTSITPNGTKVLYATNPTEPYKFFGIKAGIYAINLINGSNMTLSPIRQPMLTIESPLKQFKSGIKADDIKCDNGLSLVIKVEDNSPACVKPDTADNLMKRGWAQPTIIPSKKVHEILPLIPNNTVKPLVNQDNQTSSTLKLFISTDSTYTSPGNPVGIDISLNNTSSTPLILTKSDNWPRNDLSSGPCSNLPFGMAILKGYYTEQNMSNANSLVIFQNIPCPLPSQIKSYTFQPLSSKATQECDSLFSCTGLVDMKTHLEISGFVDNNSPHRPFSVGTYTIIAGDQWGHVTIQHFSEAYTTPLADLKGN